MSDTSVSDTVSDTGSVRGWLRRRMVFLGFGKWARADRIYALEPLEGADRGHGRRTRVWVDGLAEPIVASRTERDDPRRDGPRRAAT